MGYSTYSFEDISLTISHPQVGQYAANGAGIGSISIAMTNDRTAQDIAADGVVMVSKIAAANGTATLSVQQTSAFNRWLTKLYNYCDVAVTDQWASTTITLRAPKMGELLTLTGVSFQKLPDRPYQQQGQQVSWSLMAADIKQALL